MNYKNEYNNYIKEAKQSIPVIIDDNYIINRASTGNRDGDSHSMEYSFGICGLDVSKIDMSNLSIENFAKLSFDTKTIFSQEQLKKFKPQELLEKGKEFGLGIDRLHKAGITGEGVQVVIIDEPFDIDTPEMKDVKYTYEDSRISDKYKKVDNIHGRTVTSLLHSISPKAIINFHAVQLIGETEKCMIDINNERKEILDETLKNDMNISVISMSATIGKEETIKYSKILEETKISFIDSDSLYKAFIAGERNRYNDEINTKRIVVNQVKYENNKNQALKILPEMESEYKKLKDENSRNKLKELINKVTYFLNIRTPIEMSDILTKEMNEGLKKEGKVLIPNGCETYPQIGGGYKYNGVSSMSWTVPQLSGILVLAKQMDINISYDEFIEISKTVATKNEEGFLIINPEGIVREINEINKKKSIENPEKYVEIYKKSNKLISNLDRVIEQERKNSKDNKFISELKSGVINIEDQSTQLEKNKVQKKQIEYSQQEI